MQQKDIRRRQRFQNFREAFFKLKEAVERPELNELERLRPTTDRRLAVTQ